MPIIRFLLIFFLFLPIDSYAKDNLEKVLERMKPKTALIIAYQEKRSMGLLADDRITTGYFYTSPAKIMIKEQETPETELMGAIDKQLYYVNVKNGRHYQTEMDDNMPMSLHINAFNGLMNGDLAALEKVYFLQFNSTDKQWLIILTAKTYDEEEEERPLKIIMKGEIEKVANYLQILEADGDSSEFKLTPFSSGKKAQQAIDKLLKSLKK